jgi:ACR3 family arsenite efflux pump ArsB
MSTQGKSDSSAIQKRKRASHAKPDKLSKRALIFLFILLLILLVTAVGYKYPEVAKVIDELKGGAISATVAICVIIFCLRIIWKDIVDLISEARKNQTKK